MSNNILLSYLIDQEKKGREYVTSDADKELLKDLMMKISLSTREDIQYLAQLDNLSIHGIGKIVEEYIESFESEFVKSCLLDFLVTDKTKDCDKLIYQLYLQFKETDSYLSPTGKSAPLGIIVRYDNAFKRLKPKKLKYELCSLAHYPRDVFYLPLTIRMIASWRIPEIERLLISYLDSSNITPQSVGVSKEYPALSFIRREIKFTAIHGLRYYPSYDNLELISHFLQSEDPDVVMATKKTLHFMSRHLV